MRNLFGLLLSAIAFGFCSSWFTSSIVNEGKTAAPGSEYLSQQPNSWIYAQRAYPTGYINHDTYMNVKAQALSMRYSANRAVTGSWQLVGPINVGGRISDLAVHPSDSDKVYVGAASGGVFLVEDYGQTITPLFDDQPTMSIGDIAIDPSNPSIIYVGTGESSASSNTGAFPGNGVYKSTDGGGTWNNIGLPDSRYIGRIVVDPQNGNNIFVAAAGTFWGTNSERGVYRSQDGGNSWQQVLYINDSVACIDVAINPNDPDTVYAAMWERTRRPGNRDCAGVGSGVWRSVDGGTNWSQLTNGLPPSSNTTGKIALSVSQSNPNIVYAAYAYHTIYNYFDGLWKTTDGGNSWFQVDQSGLSNAYNSFGWYFGNVRCDPNDPDIVYVVGYRTYKSTNGGVNFSSTTSGVHVDQHAMYIHPENSNYLVIGNDGGLYYSSNGGNSWTKSYELPINQFYTCEVDEQNPNRYYGGTQDNGTLRTMTGNVDDWQSIYGGDGFYVLVDPTNNQYVYAESQYGNIGRSTNGGNSFSNGTNGINGGDRTNWNTPIRLDPSNPSTLYTGTYRVYKSTNRAQSWSAISGDLTNGSGSGNLTYGTITTIDVARTDPDVIYVGTEDGNVWNTTDGGSNWNMVSSALPNFWVTRVSIDPFDANICYVCFSGYSFDNYAPHIYKTTDGGANWTDIAANLPAFPINDIIHDPDSTNWIYIATDYGVFVSFNDGGFWESMNQNLPMVSVFDLRLHEPTHTLIAGTYGRSMHAFDLDSLSIIVVKNQELNMANNGTLTVSPNPASEGISISFELQKSQEGQLEIYDLSGRKVKSIYAGSFAIGKHTYRWDFNNPADLLLSSGNYICRFTTNKQLKYAKFVIAK